MKSYDVTIQMKPLSQYITFTGYCLSCLECLECFSVFALALLGVKGLK